MASTHSEQLSAANANTVRWMSIEEAALILSVPIVTLRRAIERHARKTPDGSVQARADGWTARKLGRLWRVHLDPAWMKPAGAGS